MTESSLDKFLSVVIARDLGVKPEQVTVEFIREMRKLMQTDSRYQICNCNMYSFGLQAHRVMSAAERTAWNQQCRAWAREVLARQTPAS